MSKNPLFRNGEEDEKVTRSPHVDPDHHQKLTTSRASHFAHACQVWSTSVSAFVSYPVYRMTERQNDHITSALLAKVIKAIGSDPPKFGLEPPLFLSASLYFSKRGAYCDRLCRDVVGRWLSRACTVAKRCILGL